MSYPRELDFRPAQTRGQRGSDASPSVPKAPIGCVSGRRTGVEPCLRANSRPRSIPVFEAALAGQPQVQTPRWQFPDMHLLWLAHAAPGPPHARNPLPEAGHVVLSVQSAVVRQ